MYIRGLASLLLLTWACGGDVVPLGRQDYKHYLARCARGIDEQSETADQLETCADARNVWAPDGTVVQRMGYEGVSAYQLAGTTATVTVFFGRAEDVSAGAFTSPTGAGILDLSNLVGRVTSGGDGDRWYVGLATPFNAFKIRVPNSNSNSTAFKAEYWNGTTWKYLQVNELCNPLPLASRGHLSGSFQAWFLLAAPNDWTSNTVDGQAAYWIRFNLLNANMDASTTVDVDDTATLAYGGASVYGMFAAQFSTFKRYLIVNSTSNVTYWNAGTVAGDDVRFAGLSPSADDEPASIAVIADFDMAYISYANVVTQHFASNPSAADPFALQAAVDTSDAITGPGAAYDRQLIVQDSSFPQAKYITYFKNRLWAANMLGRPTSVKWSAPSPAYKVWPTISEEPLVEDDNSPITGIKGFNEQLTVFKNDSVWIMVDNGFNASGLTQFVPIRVVAGVGCTSNGSIQQIRGGLVFLGEDGLYKFNGTPSIQKLSDRLNHTFSRITPGRRPFATSANWSSRHLYLLAVSVDGSPTNNLVIAWDYKNDALWLWDDIEAQHFLIDEGSYDEERLYFGDSTGRIFELGPGRTDNGGTISSYLTTQRLGYLEREKKELREIKIYGESQYTTAALSVYTSASPAAIASGTIDFTDPAETVNYRPKLRRSRRLDFKTEFDWVQVKLSNATKNTELLSSLIAVGYNVVARR